MKKSEKRSHYQKEWIDQVLHVGDKKGINAMSISDLTGIPRPTVIRKLKILLKQKDIYKDKNNLYYLINGKLFSELGTVFDKNRNCQAKKSLYGDNCQ